MLADGLIGPKEDGLLKSAIKAPKIDIQEHRHWTDVASLAELKKVVFEELVAFHGVPWDCFGPSALAMTTKGGLKPALLSNIVRFMLMGLCDRT